MRGRRVWSNVASSSVAYVDVEGGISTWIVEEDKTSDNGDVDEDVDEDVVEGGNERILSLKKVYEWERGFIGETSIERRRIT